MPDDKEKNIHEGHRQRIRNLFKERGIGALEDHVILEMLMYYVHKRKDTNAIGHNLINEFGSLEGVFSASYEDLVKVKDVGEMGAVLINFIGQLRNRITISDADKNIRLTTAQMTGEFCCKLFEGLSTERLILISMSSNRRVRGVDIISDGITNATVVNTRKILEIALKRKATCVILAHNHPGDSPNPSSNDIVATNKIINVLEGISIDVIDHIICSGDSFVSMEERQLFGF